jgi:transcriptional regulator of nitric oxide reductase
VSSYAYHTWQVGVASAALILMNAIIGFSDEIHTRVKLRSELMRHSLLEILVALHREKHVDIVRQV